MKMLKVKLNKILLISFIFTSLFFATPNLGFCDNEPKVGVAKEQTTTLPINSRPWDTKRILCAFLAISCLGAGIYLIVKALKSDNENFDFDETLKNKKNDDFTTPTTVNDAINLFLRKIK